MCINHFKQYNVRKPAKWNYLESSHSLRWVEIRNVLL